MNRPKILIVEDERILALDLKSKLETLSYDVVGHAISGEQAIDDAGRLRPDVVLMDIHLVGVLLGTDAARTIAEKYQIPIVFLTAYADDTHLQKGAGESAVRLSRQAVRYP